MITSSFLLICFGSFALYNTSKKALLQQDFALERWLQSNAKVSKIIAFISFTVALVLAILAFGTTSGILYWFVALMVVLSLLVVVFPTKKINYKHIVALFIALYFIEILN